MKDLALLFAARALRMTAYGMLAVVFALFLRGAGLSDALIGVLIALTMAGDTVISLFLTSRADRFGRRRTLMIGCTLMLVSSLVFASTTSFWLLVIAATIGVLSPSGNEIGPFLPVEQAALSEGIDSDKRVGIIAWYSVVGYAAAALGALAGGQISHWLQAAGWTPMESFRAVIIAHGCLALIMLALYSLLSKARETETPKEAPPSWLGLHESKATVLKLSGLFSLDAFAGGFVMQSLIAYWFHLRWGADEQTLGALLAAGNVLAGASSLLAVPLARRFGLLNTMVWTHLPSNVLLMLVPLMPSLPLAMAVLMLRFCLSQMDVPTRQAYVMAVVTPSERSAAGGVTNVARSIGVSLSPLLVGPAFAVPALGLPFLIGGGLKIIYDLSLWRSASGVDLKS